jgi:hypothetical protein
MRTGWPDFQTNAPSPRHGGAAIDPPRTKSGGTSVLPPLPVYSCGWGAFKFIPRRILRKFCSLATAHSVARAL